MSQIVELPENVWSALQQAAEASGVTPAGWIASRLPSTAEINGTSASAEEECSDDLEPPTYSSVPLEKVGSVQVACVVGKQIPPLPYPVEELPE